MKVLVFVLSILTVIVLAVKGETTFKITSVTTCNGTNIPEGASFDLQGFKMEYAINKTSDIPEISGNITFKTNVTSPWPVKFTGESQINAVWTKLLSKNYEDACNPRARFLHPLLESKGCPYKAGVRSFNSLISFKI